MPAAIEETASVNSSDELEQIQTQLPSEEVAHNNDIVKVATESSPFGKPYYAFRSFRAVNWIYFLIRALSRPACKAYKDDDRLCSTPACPKRRPSRQ